MKWSHVLRTRQLRHTCVAGVLSLCLLPVLPLGCGASRASTDRSSARAAYLDPSMPVVSRVADLLSRMTLEEKAGQMALISVSRLWGDCRGQPGPLDDACLQTVLIDHHVGSILSGGGESPSPNTPGNWAQTTNRIQRYSIEHSRLHIPILYGADAVHGHNNVLGATIFPHNLGMAASWDPGLVQQEEQSTAKAVRATGVHWTFAPVADIARDARWGRYYETFGEDPVLASSMVAAAVAGFQGHRLSSGVAATLKHFIGYSQPQNGHDRTGAQLSLRSIRETFVPSFQSGVDSGVAAVMANSGSVNGVPVHASRFLLSDLLRGQMHFTGPVVSDWQDIQSLYDRYHVAADYQDAIRMSVMAGVDMSMVPYDAAQFTGDLVTLVRSGAVPQSRIDQAVGRILSLKMELGLFDRPYVNVASADRAVVGADRRLARRAADETITLLKNKGPILPLSPQLHSILVTGPGAASVADQMGGWTVGWQGVPAGVHPPGVTVLDGIKREVSSSTRVVYVSPQAPAQRVQQAARRADVAVVVVGERPYAEGQGDSESLDLPANQRRLIQTVAGAGRPTVLVLMAGRPLTIGASIAACRAFLMAWLPGTEGGSAVADVLFGRVDPGARLPVSWPRTVGSEPVTYDRDPSTAGSPQHEYDPLYPFGYGLSFTQFHTANLQVTSPGSRSGSIAVKVNVSNTGPRAGDDVVEAYVHPQTSSTLAPVERLVGFRRVTLESGETKSVSLQIPTSRLAIIPGDVLGYEPAMVQPGSYAVQVGSETATFGVP